MPRNPRPRVVLLSSPDTMRDLDEKLARNGVQLVRIPTLSLRPVARKTWRKSIEGAPPPRLIIVTSPNAVPTGVAPWLRSRKQRDGGIRFWAVGPGTATALRAIGVRRVYSPRRVGNLGILAALRRTQPRNILHFRSDLAGPVLAQGLAKLGHHVSEAVVYRVRPRTHLSAAARREMTRAGLIIASSPSSLAGLEHALGRTQLDRLCRTARLVVFGPRSRKAAHELGFLHLSVAPSMTAQRFTGYLLGKLRDAGT